MKTVDQLQKSTLNWSGHSHSYQGSKGYFQVSEEEENKSSTQEEKPAQRIGCWSNRTNTRNDPQTLQTDIAHATKDSNPIPATESRDSISPNELREREPDSPNQYGETPTIPEHIVWLTQNENDDEKDDDTDQRKWDDKADTTDSYNSTFLTYWHKRNQTYMEFWLNFSTQATTEVTKIQKGNDTFIFVYFTFNFVYVIILSIFIYIPVQRWT